MLNKEYFCITNEEFIALNAMNADDRAQEVESIIDYLAYWLLCDSNRDKKIYGYFTKEERESLEEILNTKIDQCLCWETQDENSDYYLGKEN